MEILVSLIIAIIQSILFYGKELGVSVILFTTSVIGAIWYILDKKKKIINKKAIIFLIPIILLSSTYFIYGSTIFHFTNLIVIFGLILVMFKMATIDKCITKYLILKSIQLPGKAIEEVENAGNETAKALKQITKNKIPKDNLKKVITSLLVVVTVVGVVIALLASADSIFASIFSGFGDIITIDIATMSELILRIVICIIVYFATFSIALAIQKNTASDTKEMRKINTDKFTIKMLLVVLNIVYLVFCYIQITSLFTKMNAPGTFNYAEYARSGFFQLMFVSFINFALLFISNYNNDKRDSFIKILNIILIAFTVIIVLSSMYRMHMYETEYGFTYLRLFVYIILATELILFVPTTMYVCNTKTNILKWGGIIVICVYVAINFANLENIIVQRNLNRQNSTVETDYRYIARIASGDSYFSLIELLKDEKVSAKDKIEIGKALLNILADSKDMKWQEFNISRYKLKDENLDSMVDFEEWEIKARKEEMEDLKTEKYNDDDISSDRYNEIVNEI